MIRESIYSALFDLVGQAPGLVTTSRKLRHWADVSSSEMPALFLAQTTQEAQQTTGRPTRWLLGATLWVYISTVDAQNPGEVANPIVDAIANALDIDPGRGQQRLGGLVEYARIDGMIETSEGTLGDIEVIRIPIKMLTAF